MDMAKKLAVVITAILFLAGISPDKCSLFRGTDVCLAQPEAELAKKDSEIRPEKPGAKEAKIIYRFGSAEEMALFEQMHQLKQATLTRIEVLNGYLEQERVNMEQLEAQMYIKFKISLDPYKKYILTREDMTIKEDTVVPVSE